MRTVRSAWGRVREASGRWPHEGAGLHQGSGRLLDRDFQRFEGGWNVGPARDAGRRVPYSVQRELLMVHSLRAEKKVFGHYRFFSYMWPCFKCMSQLFIRSFRHDFTYLRINGGEKQSKLIFFM